MKFFMKLTSQQILLLCVSISIIVTIPIVVLMEMLLTGEITSDYLITGFVTSLFVSTFVAGILAFSITQLRKNEALVKSTNYRLEYLLKHPPAVMYACRVSGDFGATFISENVTAQLGYQANEFIEDSSFWANHIHPDDRPSVIEDLADVLKNDFHRLEYRFQHKDGSFSWMRDELAVIRDSGGQPLEMVGYWVDITERKNVEIALQESEKRFRLISSIATDLIYSCHRGEDGLFRINWLGGNSVQIFGYSDDEIIARGCWCSFVFPEDIPLFTNNITELQPGQSSDCVLRIINSTGVIRYVRSVAQVIENPVIPAKHILYGALQDISDRWELTRAIRLRQFSLDHADEQLYWVDKDARILDVNKRACQRLGYSKEELLKFTVADIDPVFPVDKWTEHWQGCDLNLKQPQQEERQRDLFFAKTVSIFESLKLMPVNLRCQPHGVVSSAYRQDKIAVL